MAGSLIKIDEFSISSAVASVILGGGSSGSSGLNVSIDSTYDVYMVKFNNVEHNHTGTATFDIRLTASGSAVTSSNYARAMKELRADASFVNYSGTFTTFFVDDVGNGATDSVNGIIYCFNFSNASEYSFITYESVAQESNTRGRQGGGVLTVTGANDGVQFKFGSGNIDSGTFTLYGLKK